MSSKIKRTKLRTSKKSKQTKLKWWYILPVILIVAVAGYTIVRFSEAGRGISMGKPSGKVCDKIRGCDFWITSPAEFKASKVNRSDFSTFKNLCIDMKVTKSLGYDTAYFGLTVSRSAFYKGQAALGNATRCVSLKSLGIQNNKTLAVFLAIGDYGGNKESAKVTVTRFYLTR